MFGHNDDQSQPPATINPVNADAPAAPEPASAPALPSETPIAPPAASPAPSTWAHPGTPLTSDSPVAPAADDILPPHPGPHPVTSADDNTPHDLLDLKQKALGQLTPIVGHLDQTPEEKFRTLMMMIQATDDQSMLQEAYDTAQKITDEKTKAQALLDVVNEINYFTQHKN